MITVLASKVCWAIAIITLGLAPTALSQERVSVREIVAKPQKWNGKMISITGYYDTGGHTTFIAESVKAAAANQERNPRIFVDLPKKTADKDIRHALHHFVRIVGVFQYRELTKKEIPIPPDRDPTARGFVERTMGFGWMGIYDKQITDVREFRVLDNK